MNKRLIVVIGMHRSGSSAITRGLQVIGVGLGNNLMPPVPGINDKGYWEDIDINALNISLLKALGHDWHTLGAISEEELSGPVASGFRIQAIDLLRTKLESADVFGIKDPRIARLLPFWQKVFGDLQVSVGYIIVCRNPLSVARSLAKRDNFDEEKSHYLWLEHMLASVTHTAGQPRIVVDYDALMEDPAGQLKRIADGLKLNFDLASPEFSEYQNEFLEGSLRHARFRAEDLSLEKTVPASVAKLFLALQELAADRSGFDSPQVASLLMRLSEQYEEMRPALAVMRARDDKAINPGGIVNGRDARNPTMQNGLAGRASPPFDAPPTRYPRLRVAVRRAIKFVWWSITFQLFEKYRQRRERLAAQTHIRPLRNDHALAVPFSWVPLAADSAPSLAVICHMFFDEMAEEFKAYLSNIPFPFDLYVTTNTNGKKRNIENTFEGWKRGSVEVRISQNRGKDIAPKLITCADVHGRYEYVLHIHTKQSPYGTHLAGWRKYLLETLIGSPEVVSSVFEVFRNLPNIGMIAPQHLEGVRPSIGWGFNYKNAETFSRRLALRLDMDGDIDFPSGSMFWARSAALMPILGIGLSFDDFPIESGQTDGTLAHVIERLYFHICESAGYDWIKVAKPDLLRDTRQRAVDVRTPGELSNFAVTHRVRLLTEGHNAGREPLRARLPS